MAAPLRKLPALKMLNLGGCNIGDELGPRQGLVQGAQEAPARRELTDACMATIVAALDAGRLNKLICYQSQGQHFLANNPSSSASAVEAVASALAKRSS